MSASTRASTRWPAFADKGRAVGLARADCGELARERGGFYLFRSRA